MSEIKTALISVWDKSNLDNLARKLSEVGIEIISSGGTAKFLREKGISVQDVSDITGFPEMLDGRVKTLHPKIHAGILAIRDKEQHIADLKSQEISSIDLVIVNFYPFEATIADEGVGFQEVIENIDIGGPTIVRAASKNFQDVSVIVDPSDYESLIEGKPQQLLNNPTGNFSLFRIGDAVSSRNIHAAIYDAMRLCITL